MSALGFLGLSGRIDRAAASLPADARRGYGEEVARLLWEADMALRAPVVQPGMSEYSPALCFRCESRARFHEFGLASRYECAQPGAVRSCYMSRPAAPMVESVNDGDKRPVAAPWFVAARSHAVRLACGVTVLRPLKGGGHVKIFNCTER